MNALTLIACLTLGPEGGIGWQKDYDAAMKQLQLSGGAAMVFFTADW